MTTYQPPMDQRIQADLSKLFQRVAVLEQQMVQATSNVPGGEAVPPAINGLLAWNFDPVCANSSDNPSSGNAVMERIVLPKAMTITNICVNVYQAGSGLTAAANYAAIYDATGTRQGLTVDQTTAWGTSGDKVMALAASVLLAAGTYYVAVFPTGTTTPKFAAAAFSFQTSGNFPSTAGTPSRFGNLAMASPPPASITLSSMTQVNGQYTWVGLS